MSHSKAIIAVLLIIGLFGRSAPAKEQSLPPDLLVEMKVLSDPREGKLSKAKKKLLINQSSLLSLECEGQIRALQNIWFSSSNGKSILRATVPDGGDPRVFVKPIQSHPKILKISPPYIGARYKITLEFNQEAGNKLSQFTAENVGKNVSIFLNRVPISSSMGVFIKEPITNNRLVLPVILPREEAEKISKDCNAGSKRGLFMSDDDKEKISFFLQSFKPE